MFSLKLYLFVFIIILAKINCDHVPVIVWNVKGTPMQLKSLSTLEDNNDQTIQGLLDSTLKDKLNTIVVYVHDRLSMEDLTPDKESENSPLKTLKNLMGDNPPVMYPSVKDPMRHFRDANCEVKDIHTAKHGENLSKVISNSVENFCIVVVHLGSKGLIGNWQPEFKSSKKNIIAVFTASKSSWYPSEDLHRKTRSLLAESDKSHFIRTDCAALYGDFINITVGESKDNDTISKAFPPQVTSQCNNVTNSFELLFEKTLESPVKVTLKMDYERGNGSWKLLGGATIQVADKTGVPNEEIELITPEIDVPLKFSYSCGLFKMETNSTPKLVVVLDRFQIQPFDVEGDFFSRSFDCVPFFTLPIWMGVFVAILFIAILNIGVYALFNIKTMDRFDDPKGKTITVPVGND